MRKSPGRVPVIDRLMVKVVESEDGCWNFTGSLDHGGYGQIGERSLIDGTQRSYRTHRIAYEYFIGPIPDGLEIDHLCRNRACCNPWHLEPVDRSTNMRRGLRKTRQTECKYGHPLIHGPKKRYCPVCRKEHARRSTAKRRAS